MPPRSRRVVTSITVALALAVTGCAPEPAPDATATGSPSAPGAADTASPGAGGGTTPTPARTSPGATGTPAPTTTATAGASPTPAPTRSGSAEAPNRAILPACDDLLPLSTVHALFGDAAEPFDVGGSAADHMPGPLAAETARGASQTVVCSWGIPFSDGGFSVVAAEVDDAPRSRLIESLRSAPNYRSTTIEGETAFTREFESALATMSVAYVFVDRVWVTVYGTLSLPTAREFAGSAVDAVHSANG